MASLVKNGTNYGLVWSDQNRHPPQVRESLKTEERGRALAKKKELEWKYHNGEHDPWKWKWYEKPVENRAFRGVGELVEEFLSYKSTVRGRDGWSESVAEKETYVMRNFARILGPERPVTEINNKDMQRIYYRAGVTSDHTRHSDYISMNTFFNWCIRNGYLEEKPDFKPDKPQSKIPKFLTPQELASIISWQIDTSKKNIKENPLLGDEDGLHWAVLGWMVLAGTGMRPGELAQLKLNHIEKDSIFIGADFTTKTRAERRAPMLFECRQAIEVLTCPRFRSIDPMMANSPYLLGRKPSYAPEKMSRVFSKAREAVLPGKSVTMYNLKDTFCVRFLCDESIPSPSGMKLNDLREILGHTSLETTLKYLKAIPFGTKIEGTIWDIQPPPIPQKDTGQLTTD